MRNLITSAAFSFLFSGCLAIHPGSIILTIDASSIDKADRDKLTEVGIFFCDEGQGDDCSQVDNYEKLPGIEINGLRERETLGLSLRDFKGPVHLRVLAGEEVTKFDEPNAGLIAQSEARVDVEKSDNLLLPLQLLPDPEGIIDLPTTAGSEVSDLSVLSCNGNAPFKAAWSENLAGGQISMTGVDISIDGDLALADLIDPNNPLLQLLEIKDIELVANSTCNNLTVAFVFEDLSGGSATPFGVVASPAGLLNAPPFPGYQLSAQLAGNLTASFDEDGFGFSWGTVPDNGDQTKIRTFFQKAAVANLNPVGGNQILRPTGGKFLDTISNAGGSSGVTVFVNDASTQLGLVDNATGNQAIITQSKAGHFPFDPQVVFLSDARILVSWFDCLAADCSVLGRIVDRAGNDQSQGFPIPANGVPNLCDEEGCFLIAEKQINPFALSLGASTDGSFVVSWNFQVDTGNAFAFELQSAFYGTDGPRLNPYSRDANVGSISPIGNQSIFQGETQTAVTPAGDIIVSWVDITNFNTANSAGVAAKLSIIPAALTSIKGEPK